MTVWTGNGPYLHEENVRFNKVVQIAIVNFFIEIEDFENVDYENVCFILATVAIVHLKWTEELKRELSFKSWRWSFYFEIGITGFLPETIRIFLKTLCREIL